MELHVQEVPEVAGEYALRNAVERTLRCTVTHVHRDTSHAVVAVQAVKVPTDSTCEWTTQICNVAVTVRKVHCIQVQGLRTKHLDIVKLHFEKASSGGEADGVSYIGTQSSHVLVAFKEEQVQARVLGQDQRIQGQAITVSKWPGTIASTPDVRHRPSSQALSPPSPATTASARDVRPRPSPQASAPMSPATTASARDVRPRPVAQTPAHRQPPRGTPGRVPGHQHQDFTAQTQVSTKRMRPILQGIYNLLQPEIRKIASEKGLNYDVNIENDEAHVVFTGSEVNTLEAAVHILGECNDIREDTVQLNERLIELLRHDSALKKLQAKIDEEFKRSNVYISATGKLRLAITKDEFQSASEFILGRFSQEGIAREPEKIEIVKARLRDNRFVALVEDPNSPTMQVIGFSDDLDHAMNIVRVAKPMTKQMYELVRLYFSKVSLQPGLIENTIQVEMGGDETVQASVRKEIEKLIASVVDEEIDVPEYVLRLLKDERKMQELKKRCSEQEASFRAVLYLGEKVIMDSWNSDPSSVYEEVHHVKVSLRALCKHGKLNAVTKFVTETFREDDISLTDVTKQYIQGGEWQLVKKVIQNHGKVDIEHQATRIIVRGFEDSVAIEMNTLIDVLEGKHVRTESVIISNPAEFRFLRGQQREQLDSIAKACDVELGYVEPDTTQYGRKAQIHITGQIQKIDSAIDMVKELRDKIQQNKNVISRTRYGMEEYFRNTQDGRGNLLAIEDKWKVAVDVTATRGLSHDVTADNIHVAVGDVTRETCDVLVCSVANGYDDLSHCGAVAEAFAEAGGAALRQAFSSLGGVAEGKVYQAACTGDLQCKALLFLGVRDWSGHSSKQMLEGAVSACVRECRAMGYSSIGFPAIGCGKLGYPPVEFASCILQAASLYRDIEVSVFAVHQDATFGSIKEALHPTDMDAYKDWGAQEEPDYDILPDVVEGSKVLDCEKPVPTPRESPANPTPEEEVYDDVPAAQASPANPTPGQRRPPSFPSDAQRSTMNVTVPVVPSNLMVIEDNMANVKADVLVITIDQADQDLRKCGAVARAFSVAIGSKKLQNDFSKVGGNGLTLGEVAVSKLENVLGCKRLLYLGLAHWTKTPTSQVIVNAIERCLSEAQALQMSTIAFPALGTGKLMFPPAEVAKCFIQAAQKFPQMQIRIVTYRNPSVLNQFRNALETREQSAPNNLILERGDITKMKCDVLVNSVGRKNKDLNQCGAVSKASLNVLGSKLQTHFKKTKGLGLGEILAYKVDQKKQQLMCYVLLHLGLDRWGVMQKQHIIKGIDDCIKYAESRGYTSIGFPALGTGNLNTPPAVLAECFMDCAARYPHMKIHLVVLQEEIHAEIYQRFKGPLLPPPPPTYEKYEPPLPSTDETYVTFHAPSRKPPPPPALPRVEPPPLPPRSTCPAPTYAKIHKEISEVSEYEAASDYFGYTSPDSSDYLDPLYPDDDICMYEDPDEYLPFSPTITFTIYGADHDATSNAKRELGEVVARKHKEKELSSSRWPALDYLPHLPQNFTAQLPGWCSKLAHVAYDGVKIRIMGEAEEVNKLYDRVVEALEKEAARIDGALIRKVKGVKAYFSHLACLETRTPKTWTKYPDYGNADLGKVDGTTGDHFLVDLDEGLTKGSVEQLMKKSWDLKENFKITKIQRIENPKLYISYMDYKKKVCDRVADIDPLSQVHTATLGLDKLHEDLHREVNEYLFFHGTTANVVEAVGAQSFDARLARQPFTYFGKGTYLAEMAAKSHQYTGQSKGRKMLIVRAVLGNVFVSPGKKPQLVRPPCRQCMDPKCTHTDLYDSVCGTRDGSDYREFILYDKDMCYPLYCVSYHLTGQNTAKRNKELEIAEATTFPEMSPNLENVEKGEELPLTSENIPCSAADDICMWLGDKRKFYRLSLQGTSGMFRGGDLSIMYGASRGVGIEEVVIGLSENSADFPELRAGQRRLTPVLICMPHNATLSSSLSINLPVPPHSGTITVLYSPATQQAGGEWRQVHDVCCFIYEDNISLLLTHFCRYCIVEETRMMQLSPQPQPRQENASVFLRMYHIMEKLLQLQPQPQPRHKIVSVFLKGKPSQKKACVEVTVEWGKGRDAAPDAGLHGKRVNHQPFTLINNRPITITMQPADGWAVREDRKQQVIFTENLMVCNWRKFHLFGDSTAQEMVAFDVHLSQCMGHETILEVYESYEVLIGGSSDGSRTVQEEVTPQSNPSNLLEAKYSSSTTSQSPNEFSEIECAYSVPSHSASAEDGSSCDGSTESCFDESTRDAVIPVNDSSCEEANVPEAGGVAAMKRFISSALSKLPTGHRAIQINLQYNHHEAMPKFDVGSMHHWAIPFQKCAKVAEYLDLHDHEWKLLASQLSFDEAIDRVQLRAKNERTSPTILLLREWQHNNKRVDDETLNELLVEALKRLNRVDIVDEMGDLD